MFRNNGHIETDPHIDTFLLKLRLEIGILKSGTRSKRYFLEDEASKF